MVERAKPACLTHNLSHRYNCRLLYQQNGLRRMTDENSLRMLESLLRSIPGVASAHVFRNHDQLTVGARVRCIDIEACDILAYCGMASNYPVKISEIDSQLCCEVNERIGLPCDLLFPDESKQIPTAPQRFGFFLAKKLYLRGLVKDNLLDELENIWRVSFCSIRG